MSLNRPATLWPFPCLFADRMCDNSKYEENLELVAKLPVLVFSLRNLV